MTKCVIIILFCFINTSFLSAEIKRIEPSQSLTISDGLSHNGVSSLLEDSHGYIWIGTFDGINRYDGYEIISFKNTTELTLLNSNRVRTLFEDDKKNIWIGTENGITLYNYTEGKFVNIYSNSLSSKDMQGPIVRKFIEDKSNGYIYCVTQYEGLLLFDSNYNFVKHIPLPTKFANYTDNVLLYDIEKIDESNYVLDSSIGIIGFHLRDESYKLLYLDYKRHPGFLERLNDQYILTDLNVGVGILKVNTLDGVLSCNIESTCLKDYIFTEALFDNKQSLWLGTLNEGVFKINDIKSLLSNCHFDLSYFNVDKGGLKISSIISSNSIGCIVGTFNKGIFRFKNVKKGFHFYQADLFHPHSYQGDEIVHVSSVDSNRVFICTLNGEAGLFNTQQQKFEPFPFNISSSDLKNIISIYNDGAGNVWVQIRNKGLFFVRHGSGVMKLVLSRKDYPFLWSNIKTFDEDKEGNIWLGGLKGIHKVTVSEDYTTFHVEHLDEHPKFKQRKSIAARYIYVDPVYDYIWIAIGSDGLFRLKIEEGKRLKDMELMQYKHDVNIANSISSNFVTSIIRLPNNELWVSTEGGGICKVENSTTDPVFIAYSEECGLSNHAVKNILYDNNGNLWLATNKGINKFNLESQRFISFGLDDGLLYEDFNFANSQLKNGYIIFSGYHGMCFFKPEEVIENEEIPKLDLDQLKIFGETIFPGDSLGKRILLEKRIGDMDEIVLEYDENAIAIGVKSLHYSNPKNYLLSYQLLPISEKWVEMSSDQFLVNFNELRPGHYNFRVKTSNSKGEWSRIKELKIVINPPLWKTPLAFILYLFTIGLILYVLVALKLSTQKLKHDLEIEHLEKNREKEVSEAKLRYFANISHEIKTPLTLISGPIEFIQEHLGDNAMLIDKLNIVQRQSKKVAQLIDQVQDLQRSDAEMLKMNYRTFCFDTFIHELAGDYEFLSKNEQKKLKVEGQSEKIFVSADKDKLEKVFNNLLNNAFKHTASLDFIQVKYYSNERELIVEVVDSGSGIEAVDLPHIFERFYQSRSKFKKFIGGSGIGLAFSKRLIEMHYGFINAESEVGKGTKITVRLPVVIEQPSASLIQKENKVMEAGKPEVPVLESHESVVSLNIDEAFRNLKVFVVEDNTDMRSFIADTLNDFFEVKTFVNGKECLAVMEYEWPSIIISDVLMPELNGFELCRMIKTNIKTSHIPVILLTACTSLDEEIQGLKEGADSYIKKPFQLSHLMTSIESLLKIRKQLRERFQLNLPLSLSNVNSQENNKADKIFLEKLYAIISDNLDNQDFELNSLAKQLYLNRTQFYQKVKELTNQTPYELLKDYRICKAAEYLLQENMTVNDAFTLTGFKSRTHFTRLFKDKFGLTPGKFAYENKK